MAGKVKRITVDLGGYPELVVIYLGMRVNMLTGLKTLLGFGPKIQNSVKAQPEGLLLHENFLLSLFPPHVGMRQYWRDFQSLETWARSEPHGPGGRNFCGIREGRGSGTRLIFRAAGSRSLVAAAEIAARYERGQHSELITFLSSIVYRFTSDLPTNELA
ncbi:MAG: DUF4188 domain-containing protein, partial [Candidatus Acidiferrales bacterium]